MVSPLSLFGAVVVGSGLFLQSQQGHTPQPAGPSVTASSPQQRPNAVSSAGQIPAVAQKLHSKLQPEADAVLFDQNRMQFRERTNYRFGPHLVPK